MARDEQKHPNLKSNRRQCTHSREENMGTWRRKRSGNRELPRGTLIEWWTEALLSVTAQSAVILSSFPRSAVLFWVLLLFFPSLTSVCPSCLTNECVRKCFIFPSSDGGFIAGWPPAPLCCQALPCRRFLLRTEACCRLVPRIWGPVC